MAQWALPPIPSLPLGGSYPDLQVTMTFITAVTKTYLTIERIASFFVCLLVWGWANLPSEKLPLSKFLIAMSSSLQHQDHSDTKSKNLNVFPHPHLFNDFQISSSSLSSCWIPKYSLPYWFNQVYLKMDKRWWIPGSLGPGFRVFCGLERVSWDGALRVPLILHLLSVPMVSPDFLFLYNF